MKRSKVAGVLLSLGAMKSLLVLVMIAFVLTGCERKTEQTRAEPVKETARLSPSKEDSSKFNCKTFFTAADAKSIGYASITENYCSDFDHQIHIMDSQGEHVATVRIMPEKDRYEMTLKGKKMIPGAKVTEENKYGEKSFIEILDFCVEIGIHKNEKYLSVSAHDDSLSTDQLTEKTRKLAELCSKRLP